MIKIGVTGGIGSGKTYVCNLLKQKGIPVYHCDDEAKRLMVESEDIRERLRRLVGNDTYIGNKLNKPVIAQFLFANSDNVSLINNIVHPVVRQDFTDWANRQNTEFVIQENALLFEAEFSDTVDVILEVYAPKHLRLTRAITRDKATVEQIEARMAQQMEEEEKRKRADYSVINDGEHDLNGQLELILQKIINSNNFDTTIKTNQ